MMSWLTLMSDSEDLRKYVSIGWYARERAYLTLLFRIAELTANATVPPVCIGKPLCSDLWYDTCPAFE